MLVTFIEGRPQKLRKTCGKSYIRKIIIGEIWNFGKGKGFFNLLQNMGHKASLLRHMCIRPGRA